MRQRDQAGFSVESVKSTGVFDVCRHDRLVGGMDSGPCSLFYEKCELAVVAPPSSIDVPCRAPAA